MVSPPFTADEASLAHGFGEWDSEDWEVMVDVTSKSLDESVFEDFDFRNVSFMADIWQNSCYGLTNMLELSVLRFYHRLLEQKNKVIVG